MKILHIDSSINGDASASRTVSAAVVDRLRSSDSSVEVTYRDLAAAPIAHLTLGAFADQDTKDIQQEFLDADTIVIGAGLYNFTIPSQLKSWFDRILVAGLTFRFSESGPEGLVGGKRVIVALSRGAVFSGASPYALFEHAETLLRATLTFIGIAQPQFIITEGVALGEAQRKAAIDAALDEAGHVALEPVSV